MSETTTPQVKRKQAKSAVKTAHVSREYVSSTVSPRCSVSCYVSGFTSCFILRLIFTNQSYAKSCGSTRTMI